MRGVVMNVVAFGVVLVVLIGCGSAYRKPDLGAIYDEAAQGIGDARNPLVVVPGILGTRLTETQTRRIVWGAFVDETVAPGDPEGARTVALPMGVGVGLGALRDDVYGEVVLDRIELDLGLLRGLKLSAYVDILATLAAGAYRDDALGESGAVDYGGQHYTCFQYPYDWRREISEHAVDLHGLILAAREANPRFEELGDALKVDVVAHSMGGLVLRYYLRYGPHPLGPNGEVPPLTWEGARYVENAVLVATPNAGSVSALEQLVDGVRFAPFTAKYRASVLGTMPAIYQLMPRSRHERVVLEESGEALDIYDVGVWERFGWGLLDPDESRRLSWLLPGVADEAGRRRVAREHVEKCLRLASAFHRAIDVPAVPPEGLSLRLFAADAIGTPSVLGVDERTGRVRVIERVPGDGTVTRASALMDERIGSGYRAFLRSPIAWDAAIFIEEDHLGITRSEVFSNNLLFVLLEDPGRVGPRGQGGD